MLERALTTACCGEIISHLLEKRGWTIARIARIISASAEYVRRVQTGKQSFQLADVEALAAACEIQPHRLIFDSMRREKFAPEMRGLYDLAKQEVERHEEFRRVMNPKTKKRRTKVKAA